ncbi:MAG: hemerythrin domain-containing protein [Sedimentisphaerales bacterium]|jgi:hemerythrin-like domain-containing protein
MGFSRRDLLVGIGGVSGGMILTGRALAVVEPEPSKEAMGGEVTATEDLMREHGVLRRALFVYSETAARLRSKPSDVVPDALQKTATLFRAFGEDYHEKKLEEAFIFPAVKKAGGEAAGYTDILIAQHNRGREITEYVLSVTKAAKIETGDAEPLAKALESMVRMYRPHAAREDTVIFPAWKQTLTAKQLDKMNDKFEDIEKEMLGENGFENAVKQISEIEAELGMADLAKFTAPIIKK